MQLYLAQLYQMALILSYYALPAVAQYTDKEKQAFVDIQNQMRGNATPTAKAMNAITWSTKLENLAMKAANKCVFDHYYGGEYAGLGENIYNGENPSPEHVTKNWFSEIQYFNLDARKCEAPAGKSCGHFSQLMTDKVLQIGCGMQRNCKGPDDRNVLVFCEYSHGDGFYEYGPSCSGCPPDRPCRNKLCSGSDTIRACSPAVAMPVAVHVGLSLISYIFYFMAAI